MNRVTSRRCEVWATPALPMRSAKGLAARLFLTHLGLTLLIIVAGGTYLTISLQRTYLHSLEASLQDHAHLLAEAVRPSLESAVRYQAVRGVP